MAGMHQWPWNTRSSSCVTAGQPHHHIQPQRPDSVPGGQVSPFDGEPDHPGMSSPVHLLLAAWQSPAERMPTVHLPVNDSFLVHELQPVVALMVPRLISSGQKWQLYGLSAARQLQIVRGEELACVRCIWQCVKMQQLWCGGKRLRTVSWHRASCTRGLHPSAGFRSRERLMSACGRCHPNAGGAHGGRI